MAEIENLKIGSGGTIHIVGNEDIVAEAWAAGQNYVKDKSYVINNHVLYVCNTSHTSVSPFDPTNWTQITVTESLTSLVDAINEVIATSKLNPVYGNTASGVIATFDTSLALPLQDCKVKIEAIQSGSGTPSPDNVRQITGFTECNVTRTSKNLITPTLSPNRNPRIGGVTVTKDYDNVILTTTSAIDYTCYGVFYSLKKGTYTFKYQANSSDSYIPSITIYRKSSIVVATNISPNTARTFTLAEDTTIEVRLFASTVGNGVVGRVVTFYEMQLELGTTATDYEPYNGETKTIDFNGNTVYGGLLDVTTGVLTVTHSIYTFTGSETEYIQQTNRVVVSTTIRAKSSTAICTHFSSVQTASTRFVYIPTTLSADDLRTFMANNTVSVVYELATPVTYQLTPTQISAIVGTNNVFTDTNGDTSVVYACSLKDYIDSQ